MLTTILMLTLAQPVTYDFASTQVYDDPDGGGFVWMWANPTNTAKAKGNPAWQRMEIGEVLQRDRRLAHPVYWRWIGAEDFAAAKGGKVATVAKDGPKGEDRVIDNKNRLIDGIPMRHALGGVIPISFFIQQDDEEPVKPKQKPKTVQPKGVGDWIKFTGIGTIKGNEVVVKNVAYAIAFTGKVPGEGRTIAFTGTFDGSTVKCTGWSRPLEGRSPFVDFTAEGVIKLVAPGKDYFLSNGVRIELPFVADDVQDAAEAGQRIRVIGGLESTAERFVYRVTRMEVVK